MKAECAGEFCGRHFHLQAYFARAEIDFVLALRAFVNHGCELLFHSDRGATAVHVSRERQKFFLRQHSDGFFSHRGGGFFQVEFALHGHDENEVRKTFALGVPSKAAKLD